VQKIKNIVLPALLTLCVFSSVLYTSCKDKCGSTSCQNGGTCVDGVCECPQGYSGNGCQTSWSSLFTGTYNCTKTCSPAINPCASWQSVITVDATDGGYTVDISDFGGCTSISAVATVTIDTTTDSAGTINITPNITSGITAHGNLQVGSSSIITMTYSAASGGGITGYQCNMVMTKE
jgi:hypothetical protein